MPCGDVLAGPEVEPVAAIRSAEPVVLDDYHNEEPLYNCISHEVKFIVNMDVVYQNDLPREERCVERRYMARCLAIVFRQTDQEHTSHCPHQASNYHTDCDDYIRVCSRSTTSRRSMLRGFGQF